MALSFQMSYDMRYGGVEQYANSAIAYFDRFESTDWQELNSAAWTFYENIDDPKPIGKSS